MVQLNSISNNSKVVYLKDLTTENGELIIDVTTNAGSPYSFTNAVTIESYEDTTPYEPINFNGKATEAGIYVISDRSMASANKTNATTVDNLSAATNDETVVKVEEDKKPDINVFPNPFTSRIDVEVTTEKSANISILMYDLNSRIVYRSAELKQAAGRNKITVNLPSSINLPPGSYIVTIMVNGKLAKSVKLINVN
jgi:hypothetical protein